MVGVQREAKASCLKSSEVKMQENVNLPLLSYVSSPYTPSPSSSDISLEFVNSPNDVIR
jgi:hypothetical protein